jgi:hypothetical protein
MNPLRVIFAFLFSGALCWACSGLVIGAGCFRPAVSGVFNEAWAALPFSLMPEFAMFGAGMGFVLFVFFISRPVSQVFTPVSAVTGIDMPRIPLSFRSVAEYKMMKWSALLGVAAGWVVCERMLPGIPVPNDLLLRPQGECMAICTFAMFASTSFAVQLATCFAGLRKGM